MESVCLHWNSKTGLCALLCFIFLSNCKAANNPDCSSSNYTTNSQLATNIATVLNNLVNSSSQNAAFNISVTGQNSNFTVYGLLQCRGDKTAAECYSCSKSARTEIQRTCVQSLGASIWTNDTCFMRFDHNDFIGNLDQTTLVALGNVNGVSDTARFMKVVKELLTNLSVEAVSSFSTRYASGSAISDILNVYGMVQCWRDISTDDCRSCLDANLQQILTEFNGSRGAQSITESCLTRYESYDFYNATVPPPSGSDGSKSKVAVILGVIGGSILILLLGVLLVWVKRKGKPAAGVEALNPEEDNIIIKKENAVIFTAQVLKHATNDFHDDLKLGQGGFGAVYKGTLPNGIDIAVKKLSSRATQSQGQKEFMNEIKLLANIQHRNLVSLLGCCVDGSQRMLVYEYLPNRSIDKILFDSNKKSLLDWPQRFQIMLGVAKGLLYLHEDSKLKIIHRDIKAANVLLDEKFNPKIADFGLAKLFPEDQTRIHTIVAGTYGYMAPEYAMQGHLSTKTDVYSFGILILEMISGKKSTDFDLSSGQTILSKAWRYFQQENAEDIVDESMTSSISNEQVTRCIHVGLLCTQADPSLRPPMSTVLLMLTSPALSLPDPAMPAFMSFSSD